MKYTRFVFERYQFDYVSGTLSLHYGYLDGPGFVERIVFGPVTRELVEARRTALDQAFRLLHLFAGVSYFKAFLPDHLECRSFELDATTAAFAQKVYANGLAEFAFRNNLSLSGRINFDPTVDAPRPGETHALPRMTLVPVGGGKDSIVTVECLKRAEEPLTLFALGNADPIAKTIEMARLPYVRVMRSLDPLLFKLNDEGALNGHVPITAILSVIAVCSALLSGADTIAMSNESSASAPNLQVEGVDINHQYSKSFEFEVDLAEYVSGFIASNLRYFSFLRPLTEVGISREFAKLRQYLTVFRSCNTAFKQDPKKRSTQWCCECPKCRFVFLALAPFVTKRELVSVFGQNLLEDPLQLPGYAELCGLSAFKPFECVGQIEESAALICHLGKDPKWSSDAVVTELARRIPPRFGAKSGPSIASFLKLQKVHRLPDHYLSILNAAASPN